MKKIAVIRIIASALCMVGLLALTFSPGNLNVAHARSTNSLPLDYTWDGYLSQCDPTCRSALSQAAVPEGEIIIVTNANEEINGNTSNPAALIADPGPDGISLREAMLAAEGSSEFDIIRFTPSLKGSVIDNLYGLPTIGQGNIMIDGNIDGDSTPDIIIDGINSARDTGFVIYGGSHVRIKGFEIRNFDKHGISISPDSAGGKVVVEDIFLYQNLIYNTAMNTIEINIWQQNHTAIHDVEIVSNTLQYSGGGIAVHAGMGEDASDNEVSGISIRNNTIDNPGYNIAVFISPASSSFLSRNTIKNVEIRGNQIRNHLNTSILIDSSNQVSCNNNTTENITVADNVIDAEHVTIEVVGESGMYSTGNLINGLYITGNVLTRGGIQISGATGTSAHDNAITTVQIERNHISSCMANGIFLMAGSGGSYRNQLQNVTLRDNLVNDCADAGILLHGDTSYSPNNTISNVLITNQTLVNNGNSWAGGLNINTKDASNTITGVTFTNSILWGNAFADSIRGALVPAVVANNLFGDLRFVGSNGNFYQDPQFVDPAAANFRLQAASACVDGGDPSAAYLGATDLDGHVRVWDGNNDASTVVDCGAWEYGAPAAQEMNVSGGGISIAKGDVIPTLWDATDFGAALLEGTGLEQIFTIENTGAEALHLTGTPVVQITGTNAADFSIVTQPGPQIAGGESVTFIVRFTPQAAGVREAALSIANDDSDENPYVFSIQGTGVTVSAEPEMNVTGSGISILSGDSQPSLSDETDFGSVNLGEQAVRHAFTIENTGDASLNLTGNPVIAITGPNAADFTIVSQPGNQVSAGQTLSFSVDFAPSAAGLRTATVSIASDDSDENPYTFAIQGSGMSFSTEPEINVIGNTVSILNGDNLPSSSDATDFGNVALSGETLRHTFTVENTGDADLHLTGNPVIVISGPNAADFTVVAQPASLIAAGQSVSFSIDFTPSAAGLRQAVVSIANDDGDENPYTFAIQGTGANNMIFLPVIFRVND